MNDVAFTTKASNRLRCYAIRLGTLFVYDVKNRELMGTIFSRG